MSPRPRTCEVCGVSVPWSGIGRAPKRCLEHRRNRRRDLTRASVRVARPALLVQPAAPTAPAEPRPPTVAQLAWRARRLAVGLGLDPTPERAAKLVGLEAAGDELVQLAREAARHEELTQRRTGATAALLQSVISLIVIRLAEHVDSVGPGLLAAQLKALTATLQALQGHTGTAYSQLTLLVEGPDGQVWDPVAGTVQTKAEGTA